MMQKDLAQNLLIALMSLCFIVLGIAIFHCDPSYRLSLCVQNNSSSDIIFKIKIVQDFYSKSTDVDTGFNIPQKGNVQICSFISTGGDINYSDIKLDSLAVNVNDNLKYIQTPVDYTKWQQSGDSQFRDYTFTVTDAMINN
jgi:hypothetical protein